MGALRHQGLEAPSGTRVPRRLGLLSESALEAPGSLIVDDTGHDPRFSFVEGGRFGMQSLVAGLCASGSGRRAFCSSATRCSLYLRPARWTSSAKLAAAISLAMENARLHEAERHIADTLQEALLTVPASTSRRRDTAPSTAPRPNSAVSAATSTTLRPRRRPRGHPHRRRVRQRARRGGLTSLVKNAIRIFAHEESGRRRAILAKTNSSCPSSQPSTFVTAFLAHRGLVRRGTRSTRAPATRRR